MDDKLAQSIIKSTSTLYNRISSHFSQTRQYLPFLSKDIPLLTRFLQKGDNILDWGCGNGILLTILNNYPINYYGVDVSKGLIDLARKKYPRHTFQVVPPLKLPFQDDYFNVIYLLSMIHHIPSEKLRLKILQEAFRVLKDKGKLVITGWNPLAWDSLSRFVDYFNKKDIRNLYGLDPNDFFYPWRNPKGQIIGYRYFHCFSLKELKDLVQKAGFNINKACYLDKKNKKKAHLYLLASKGAGYEPESI